MSVHAWFVSDIHLKSETESKAEKLLLFLHSIENSSRPATHLFLVGDIFDLWIYKHRYFVEKYPKIINAIRVIVDRGIEVHYFEGNHDLYLKRFWQQDVGVRVHEGPEFFNLGSKKIRVEHGDFMNPEDKGYLFLRKLLRSAPIRFIAHNLPGSGVNWIGERASRASRNYTSDEQKWHQERVLSFMHDYADQVIDERFFDYLITGHTHLRDVYEFDASGEQVFSINLGSWFEDQKALLIDDQGHQFVSL